jgi:hypothetical protein
MGIRFKCPNGHKIHVKSFLAGKKGVCPDCGARVRIPLGSLIHKDGSPIDPAAGHKEADDEDAHEIPPETPAMKSGEDLREAMLVPKGAVPPQAFKPMAAVPPQPAALQGQPAAPAQPAPQSMPAAPVAAAAAVPAPQPAMPAPGGYPAAATAVPAARPAGVAVAAVPAPGAAMPMGVAPGMATAVPVGMGAPMATAVAVPVGGVRAAVPVGGMPMAQPAAVAAVPVTAVPRPPLAPSGPMPPGLIDPITEAPQAVWYVRPAGGGQYGPARGDIFRQWLGQGRVAPDSLVWREGWADWRNAAVVFPELQNQPGLIAPGIGGTPAAAGESSTSSLASYKARRRSSTMVGIGMIVMLGLVCLVLIGVLIFVLPRIQ